MARVGVKKACGFGEAVPIAKRQPRATMRGRMRLPTPARPAPHGMAGAAGRTGEAGLEG